MVMHNVMERFYQMFLLYLLMLFILFFFHLYNSNFKKSNIYSLYFNCVTQFIRYTSQLFSISTLRFMNSCVNNHDTSKDKMYILCLS